MRAGKSLFEPLLSLLQQANLRSEFHICMSCMYIRQHAVIESQTGWLAFVSMLTLGTLSQTWLTSGHWQSVQPKPAAFRYLTSRLNINAWTICPCSSQSLRLLVKAACILPSFSRHISSTMSTIASSRPCSQPCAGHPHAVSQSRE